MRTPVTLCVCYSNQLCTEQHNGEKKTLATRHFESSTGMVVGVELLHDVCECKRERVSYS